MIFLVSFKVSLIYYMVIHFCFIVKYSYVFRLYFRNTTYYLSQDLESMTYDLCHCPQIQFLTMIENFYHGGLKP